MRTLILTLLIVLLPWRVWVGEAMAAGYMSSQAPSSVRSADASQPSVSTVSVSAQHAPQAPAVHHEHQDHHPCQGHADHSRADIAPSAVASTDHAQDQSSSASCSNCGHCDMCHSVALLHDLQLPVHPGLPYFSWPLGHSPFASAITAPGHKPPIA